MSTSRRPSLLLNMMSNWSGLVAAVLIGFFLTSYIIGELGKTGFGIWMLISSIVGYYGILDLGIESAISRYVARYAAQKDYEGLNSTINTALVLFCIIGGGIILASFWIDGFLAQFFDVAEADVEAFKKLIIILGISVGLSFPGNLFGAIIKAHERFLEANLVDIIILVLRAGIVVALLEMDMGVVGIGWANLVSAVLMLGMNYYLCRHLFPHVQFNLFGGHWKTLVMLMGFGIATTIMEISNIMRFNLDSFVIGKWLGLAEVGIYGVAAVLVRYYLQFISAATISVFTPRFSSIAGEQDRAYLQKLFLKSLSIGAFLSFAIATPMLIWGEPFVRLWAGAEFVEVLPTFWVLTIAYAVTLSQSTSVAMMYALKRHQLFAVISLIEGVVNVALSIYLAPIYGIFGVALGTAIPMLILKVFLQPLYLTRILEVPLAAYLRQLYLPLLLALFFCGIWLYFPHWMPNIQGYFALVFWSLPMFLAFAALYAYQHPEDRQRFLFWQSSSAS
ncbi:oligosaccharide flippase family protein [Candidatus Venteria ishoeyi]|uniref:oligosaccharide flippase family protein n=1 Tax=Candidatus Venteria ishoeyi TaxID=1899563 RepID=UPI0025A63A4A|nr:oligosaccharide flippase family protein [Candidatus Venteria ishoeyi]MDM8545569.1 oligosaccharide flippase family protein [Candidatus Venteria ishoeyi]